MPKDPGTCICRNCQRACTAPNLFCGYHSTLSGPLFKRFIHAVEEADLNDVERTAKTQATAALVYAFCGVKEGVLSSEDVDTVLVRVLTPDARRWLFVLKDLPTVSKAKKARKPRPTKKG